MKHFIEPGALPIAHGSAFASLAQGPRPNNQGSRFQGPRPKDKTQGAGRKAPCTRFNGDQGLRLEKAKGGMFKAYGLNAEQELPHLFVGMETSGESNNSHVI